MQEYEVEILATNGPIKFTIDTGADVSVIGVGHLEKFGLRLRNLRRTKKSLVGPDANKLQCLGDFKANFKTKDQISNQICYVCKNIMTPLLGRPGVKELGIVKVNVPNQVTCASVTPQQGNEFDTGHTQDSNEFVKNFSEVFNGLGKIKGDPVCIALKDGATPYHFNAPRRVALLLLDPFKEELNRMEELGLIQKIDKPTGWHQPIVVVPKANTKLRICIDLTKLNDQVKREHYQLPSVEETLAKLGDSCVF